jgi:hypothetical protein
MTRTHRLLSCLVIGMAALLHSGTSVDAQGVDPWRRGDESLEGYMARAPLAEAAEAVALKFIESAVAKDVPTLLRMVSPTSVAAIGQSNTEHYLQQAIVPFFSAHKAIGRSTTTATARAENGQVGFGFHMYSIQTNSEKKPFVIYVLQDGGEWRIANVLVDQFIPGRHRPTDEQ